MSERALVVIPTYNERGNIERIIAAVLTQDERLEVLVVDDGSPDGTGEIVDGSAGCFGIRCRCWRDCRNSNRFPARRGSRRRLPSPARSSTR